MKSNQQKVQLVFNPNMNVPTTGIPHNEIVPRAEIVFVQTDTTQVECYLNCTPEITEQVKSVPRSQVMAFKVFMLLGQLINSGQLMEVLNMADGTDKEES